MAIDAKDAARATVRASTRKGEATSKESLSPRRVRALFDLLSHHETYTEVEGFKYPDAVRRYGYPFTPFTTASGATTTSTTPWSTAPNTPRLQTPAPPAEQSDWMRGKRARSKRKDNDDDAEQAAAGGSSSFPSTPATSTPSSESPLLQTLLTRFVLRLPGVRHLPPAFWSVRVQGLLARLGEAELSESYDKGALGARKTLATGFSAVVEMLARGALGGVQPSTPSGEPWSRQKHDETEYDGSRAEELARAWDDVVQGIVYGELPADFFDHLRRTEDIEAFSPAVRASADYVILHLASLAHHVFSRSAEGQYLLKLIGNVHGLVPYRLMRQTLRIGNAATMINGMVRLLLAKLSVTSLTNWFGLTQNADDGMNLLQRILSLVLAWDASDFRKSAESAAAGQNGLEADLDRDDATAKPAAAATASSPPPPPQGRPPEEALRLLRDHIQDGTRAEHEAVRATSRAQGRSVVAAALESVRPGLAASLTPSQHACCLSYFSALLSVRDRERIGAALCRQPPDLLTALIKEAVAAYDPIIRSVHTGVDLREPLDAVQAFLDDFLVVATPGGGSKKDQQQQNLPSVADYVALLRRHRGRLYRYLHLVARGCPGVWDDLRSWAVDSAAYFRPSGDAVSGSSSAPPSTADHLNRLVDALDAPIREAVLAALDAHAEYLDTLGKSSRSRLQALLNTTTTTTKDTTSSDPPSPAPMSAGPGAYLARWQALLDTTALTPTNVAPGGRVRSGRDARHATTMGKTGVGVRKRRKERAAANADPDFEADPEAPDPTVVLEALGEGFRVVVREMASRWGDEPEGRRL